VTTSSGLAAAPTPHEALIRAVQELVERDALMVTWLRGIPGRRMTLQAAYAEPVEELGGDAVCIDATPAYSPHPVALVCGQLPLRGHPRYSLGRAFRETWQAAVEKAYLELIQGVVFAGYYVAHHPDLRFGDAGEVRTFDDHAVYYTVRPDQWAGIPLLAGRTVEAPTRSGSLASLARAFENAGLRVYTAT
jgi:ribosomal protein S12 methylthiotransferase accessory factor